MSVTYETDERVDDRFRQAVMRKLAELAEEFPELEAAGRQIDPATLFEVGTPEDRVRWAREDRERAAVMDEAQAVIARLKCEDG